MKILDTTLRDGSYVYKWSPEETGLICAELDLAGIDFIEVGNGTGMGVYPNDTAYMEAARNNCLQSLWGMFCIPGIATLDNVKEAADFGMAFIRVGTNVDEYAEGRGFIEVAKSLGMFVAANFMKAYARPPIEFGEAAEAAASYGADVIYIVDSAGNMLPETLHEYVYEVPYQIKLGFHGHNNLGLANANALEALHLKCDIIDTSLQGIGRCTGNTNTEQFVAILKRMGLGDGYDLFRLMDTGEKFVRPIIPGGGIGSLDLTCGFAGFHSSYLDTLVAIANEYKLDPRKLIIEICKRTQEVAPKELVIEVAHALAA